MNDRKEEIRQRVRERTAAIRRAIGDRSLIALGTIHTRTKVCGRKSCPCSTDPDQRHGPYHEWSRVEDGRLAHTILSEEQAELFAEAIASYREVQDLLSRWQHETVEALLSLRKRKGQR